MLRPLLFSLCALVALVVSVGRATSADVVASMQLSNVASISAGQYHTCVVTSEANVSCWGMNDYGELGSSVGDVEWPFLGPQNCALQGQTSCSTTPIDVQGIASEVIAVSSGWVHTCALTSLGGVKCWGSNAGGQLGDGSNTGPDVCGNFFGCSVAPVDVPGLTSGITQVSAAGDHTCALTASGGVKCWGSNQYGQLGNGTKNERSTPSDVAGLASGVKSVSRSCALTSLGGVKCWGANPYGELGNGTQVDSNLPVDVVGLGSGVIAISSGFNHACALLAAGGVKCWGSNFYGQLGNGTSDGPQTCTLPGVMTPYACSMTPVDVEGLTSSVAQISAGSFETCALLASSEVKCWGSNTEGQLGVGNDAGPEFCRVGTASLACSSVPVLVDLAGTRPATISVGGSYVCALSAKASALCWGSNFAGALGDGTTTPTGTAISVVAAPVYEIGDANCDRSVDAVDAALVLQAVANVLSRALPCMQNVDVNGSIYADAQDATLILQFGAGLVSLLWPP